MYLGLCLISDWTRHRKALFTAIFRMVVSVHVSSALAAQNVGYPEGQVEDREVLIRAVN